MRALTRCATPCHGWYDATAVRVTAALAISLLFACEAAETSVPSVDAGRRADAARPADASLKEDAGGLEGDDAGLGADAGAPEVTWHRDVAPIVQDNCINCHRTGGIGPFSMEQYDTAAPKAAAMAGAVLSGYMPPWNASEGCQTHLDARVISDREKGVIARWAELGAPEGDPADGPPPPTFDTLDRIDVEGDPGVDYTPSGEDDYRCFIIDLGLTETEQVVALEILPGVSWMVHHVVLFQANILQAETADAVDPGPGWSCFGGPGVTTTSPFDSAAVGAWAPGTPVTRYPPGTGVNIGAGNVIVMQVHYHPESGAAEPDRTTVRMKLADAPVTSAWVSSVYDGTFAIPPRDPASPDTLHESTVTWPVTIPGTLFGVFPHMHLLGRRISLRYVPPGGGASTCLAEVPSWDFEWQQFYFYDRPGGIRLETGGTLEITCAWARPTAGPTIYWGEGSNDEMCIVGLYVTP